MKVQRNILLRAFLAVLVVAAVAAPTAFGRPALAGHARRGGRQPSGAGSPTGSCRTRKTRRTAVGAPPTIEVVTVAAPGGFDWIDAGIGVAFGLERRSSPPAAWSGAEASPAASGGRVKARHREWKNERAREGPLAFSIDGLDSGAGFACRRAAATSSHETPTPARATAGRSLTPVARWFRGCLGQQQGNRSHRNRPRRAGTRLRRNPAPRAIFSDRPELPRNGSGELRIRVRRFDSSRGHL